MAFNVQQWAYEQPLKAPLKPVLVALAWHADESGVAWPGADRLAFETGYSRRTVLGALSRLEELGVIVALEYPRGGRGRATVWRLKGAGETPFDTRKGAGDARLETSKGAAHAQKGAAAAHQQSGTERTKSSARPEDLEALRPKLISKGISAERVELAFDRVEAQRQNGGQPKTNLETWTLGIANKLTDDEIAEWRDERERAEASSVKAERIERCRNCDHAGRLLDDGVVVEPVVRCDHEKVAS